MRVGGTRVKTVARRIELALAVLVIGILVYFAFRAFIIPVGGSLDKTAQSDIDSSMKDAMTLYVDAQSFGGATAASLHATDTSIAFVPGFSQSSPLASAVKNAVSFETSSTGSPQSIVFASFSPVDSICWAGLSYQGGGYSSLGGEPPGSWYGAFQSGPGKPSCNAANAVAIITGPNPGTVDGTAESGWQRQYPAKP